MKVGTVPKITAGAVVIIVLAFIGTRQFISSREDSSPSVEVVASTPNETTNSVTQTVTTRKRTVTAPLREDRPQISAEEMQQVEDFFAQLDEADPKSEMDRSQQATDSALDENADATDSSTTSESTTQSAEDVMNEYLEAFRNFDVDAMRSFLTGAAKEEFESSLPMGELPKEVREIYYNSGMPEDVVDETLQMIRRMMQSTLKQMFSQVEVVSSKYVGEEFHFRLKVPSPEISDILGMMGRDISEGPEAIEVPEIPEVPDFTHKMRKMNGVWQIYE